MNLIYLSGQMQELGKGNLDGPTAKAYLFPSLAVAYLLGTVLISEINVNEMFPIWASSTF